jgi:hypothetical protein
MADSIIKKYILTRVSGSASAALAAASKVAAAISAAAALVSQTAAAASATAAAASATAAASSATGAAASATAAAGSATAAASSVTSAATQATNSASSATAAAGSATNAAASAAAATTNGAAQVTLAAAQVTLATTQANNAATSATEAATSATAATTNGAAQVTLAAAQVTLATTQANNAAASYDSFDDRYLGAKASNPTIDNDGNALLTGALYFNTTVPEMRVWNGSAWVNTPFTATGALLTANNLSELAASPSDARGNLGLGTLATQSGTFSGTSSGTNTGDQNLSGLQPLDAELTALAGLASEANKLPYFTGSGTATLADLVAYGRTLIALADAAALAAQLANQSISNPTVTNYTEAVVAIGNSGTAQTIVLTNGTVQTCTLTGNCTFTMPTATAGKSFILLLKTGAGSFTSTFTGAKWTAGTAPTITATASKMDIISFVADGANWYGSIMQNYTP